MPANSPLLYHFTNTGFSPDSLNILLKLSLIVFLELIFSFWKIRSMSSKLPSNDAESMLSVLLGPPTTLALVWNALSSPICQPTMTMTWALASAALPLAVACTLYMPGARNVCVMDVHFHCVPSPKSRSISFTFPLVIIHISFGDCRKCRRQRRASF